MASSDHRPPDRFTLFEDFNRLAAEAQAHTRRLMEVVQRVTATSRERRQHLERRTVLVVDDEPAVRAVVGRLLLEAGYRVVLARSGGEALDAMQKLRNGVDLLLSDLRMPQMDGVRLATEVRRIQPDASVLLMAAYPSEDPLQWPVVLKPFATGQLEAEVSRVLDARRRS
jgi:two-component system, cell cycle response regulator CpdR